MLSSHLTLSSNNLSFFNTCKITLNWNNVCTCLDLNIHFEHVLCKPNVAFLHKTRYSMKQQTSFYNKFASFRCIKMVVTYFLSVFDPGPYYSIALCARVPTLCSGQIIRHLLNMKLCKVTCISHPLGIPLKQLYFATSVWHAYIFQNEFLFYDFMPYYFQIFDFYIS